MSGPAGQTTAARPFRLTRVGAVMLVVALVTTWVLTRQVGAVSDPGQGLASGQILKVDPRAGALSIGVTLGEALAGHTNYGAKAQSLWLDLGAIGTSLTTSSCGMNPTLQPDQIPEALIVENTQGSTGTSQTQSQYGGVAVQAGQASSAPYAKAVTSLLPVSLPGVLSIGPSTATSWSGIVDGQRQAGATVDIGSVTLFGLITITGMHWQVLDESTGHPSVGGSFSLGSISVGKAINGLGNPITTLAQLNGLLGPLGIQIQPPTVHEVQGTEYVDPLTIAIVPNTVRDNLLEVVLKAYQPIREPLFDAIEQDICQATTPLEIYDIALGSISGAGSFDIKLGGIQASSGEVAANKFDLGGGFGSSTVGPLSTTVLGSGTQSGAVTSGPVESALGTGTPPVAVPGPAPAPAAASGPSVAAAQPITAIHHGTRGGALAVVALVGLAILALLAEGDRRMMRRAQRAVALNE